MIYVDSVKIDNMQLSQRRKRIEYIDALRGFTMFLVVFGHIVNTSRIDLDMFIIQLIASFRMPLFFFVSGLVGYKRSFISRKDYFNSILKKIVRALFPCFIFFTLASLFGANYVYHGNGLFDARLFTEGFGGYWFVPVLFYMFVIYYTSIYIGSKISNIVINYIPIVLFVASLGLMVFVQFVEMPIFVSKGIVCLDNFSRNLPFFMLGILAKQYSDLFYKLLNQEIFNALLIISWLVFCLMYHYEVNSFYGLFMWARCIGFLVMFSFFYHCRDFYERNGRISKCMQFLGRNTLDIYLVHYFFIPILPIAVVNYLNHTSQNNAVLLLFCVSILTLLVISMCLAISTIVKRNSNILSHIMFGTARLKK